MSDQRTDIVNALTIDVEDYYHVTALASVVDRARWEKYESRVEKSTGRLLDILGAHGVQATFFVLGWVAERVPALVRQLHAAGHEIACHGYSHQLVYRQSPETFLQETRRSKSCLEDLIGARVRGYRAASYSITRESLWALEILEQLGFEYDSSVFPVRHDLYGMPGTSRTPYRVANGALLEIPLTTVQFAGAQLPCAGGGYFRLLPYGVFRWCLRRVNREGLPAVFYMHPWEIDPDQPRLAAGWRSRFRHYLNLSRTEGRLRTLLADFRWDRMDRVFLAADAERSDRAAHVLASEGAH
jgi:polysaccharide deacetylase family protein (PEP-CTERM system associated)